MNRGMKQYMPFASLNEQVSFVKHMLYERSKIEKKSLGDDEQESINRALIGLKPKQKVVITFYRDGHYYTEEMIVKRIDFAYKKILFDKSFVIAIDDITAIELI
ncbi:MAG TPA: YolD-like family protein [Bacilli bacterium]|nr:YolD-like family protein [Bacilli bacterium]